MAIDQIDRTSELRATFFEEEVDMDLRMLVGELSIAKEVVTDPYPDIPSYLAPNFGKVENPPLLF